MKPGWITHVYTVRPQTQVHFTLQHQSEMDTCRRPGHNDSKGTLALKSNTHQLVIVMENHSYSIYQINSSWHISVIVLP